MTSLSRLLCFALILNSVVVVSARGDTAAQTPDAKSKGTGSISGKVTLGGKAVAGIPVAALGNDKTNQAGFSAARQSASRSRGLEERNPVQAVRAGGADYDLPYSLPAPPKP